MLRLRATTIRATGAKDELVREARRLGDVVTNLPRVDPTDVEEASREISGATEEIERIDRLTGSLEDAAPAEERAVVSKLAEASSAARRRRRRVRSVRRRLLNAPSAPDLAA